VGIRKPGHGGKDVLLVPNRGDQQWSTGLGFDPVGRQRESDLPRAMFGVVGHPRRGVSDVGHGQNDNQIT
jgi:hypothetical protein